MGIRYCRPAGGLKASRATLTYPALPRRPSGELAAGDSAAVVAAAVAVVAVAAAVDVVAGAD